MIWLKVFLLSCLGGKAGGWLSTPSGDLSESQGQRGGDRSKGKGIKKHLVNLAAKSFQDLIWLMLTSLRKIATTCDH